MRKVKIRDITRKKKHTKKDIENARMLYHDNFEKLMKNVGKPSHEIYIKRERILDSLIIMLIEKIENRNMKGVCRLSKPVDCFKCTGYLKRSEVATNTRNATYPILQAEKPGKGVDICPVFEYMEEMKETT